MCVHKQDQGSGWSFEATGLHKFALAKTLIKLTWPRLKYAYSKNSPKDLTDHLQFSQFQLVLPIADRNKSISIILCIFYLNLKKNNNTIIIILLSLTHDDTTFCNLIKDVDTHSIFWGLEDRLHLDIQIVKGFFVVHNFLS